MDQNRLSLFFKDQQLEEEYRLTYEEEIRGPLRLGIIISILSWLSGLSLVYFVIPEKFYSLSLLTLVVICPFFLFIVYATYNERFKGWIHIIGAMSNAWAGLYAIYFCNQFPNGTNFVLPVLIFILFFGSYLVRLRWIAGFIAAFIYTAGFHYYMIYHTDMDISQVSMLAFVAWLTLIFAILAGHVTENNGRIRFTQEKTIQEQSAVIEKEKEASERLLLNILPPSIARRLKENDTDNVIADIHKDASVMFADIVGFTKLSAMLTADELLNLLNKIFSHFDLLADKHGLEKIKTIGDGYMVAGGLTKRELGKEYIQPDEGVIIEEMIAEMKAQVDRLYEDKVMKRQVHTKMHGCVKASFTVESNLPEECRTGVFQEATEYDAWVRFSNSNTIPKADSKKDIRGVAIKLLGVPGEKILEDRKKEKTQDFILMSSETFFSRNIEAFRGFMKAVTAPGKLRLLGYFINPLHWKMLGRLMKSLISCDNPLSISYWSTQPYRFGAENKAVKYFLRPSSKNTVINENTSDYDYLKTNLAQTLNSHEAVFDFCIQFQTDAVTMPIENPTISWGSKFIKVAELRIIPQQFDSKEQMTIGENLSFNPWHSLPEHKPLGSFNRARREAYITMSKYRHDKNNIEMREPEDSTDFLKTTKEEMHYE